MKQLAMRTLRVVAIGHETKGYCTKSKFNFLRWDETVKLQLQGVKYAYNVNNPSHSDLIMFLSV
jgi:hypothetical protein